MLITTAGQAYAIIGDLVNNMRILGTNYTIWPLELISFNWNETKYRFDNEHNIWWERLIAASTGLLAITQVSKRILQ